MKKFGFGRKFIFALFFVPLTCILILSGKDDCRMVFAKGDKKNYLNHSIDQSDRHKLSHVKETNINVEKIVYGSKQANNQIILYLSPTCRSCAKLLKENIDYFKNLIDNSYGNINFEIKPYINSKGDLDVAKLMYILPSINGKAGGIESMNVLLKVFENQNDWIKSKNPKTFLMKVLVQKNLMEQVNIQMGNRSLKNSIISKYKIDYDYFSKNAETSLPIIIVNNNEIGKINQYNGNLSKDEIRKFIKSTIK